MDNSSENIIITKKLTPGRPSKVFTSISSYQKSVTGWLKGFDSFKLQHGKMLKLEKIMDNKKKLIQQELDQQLKEKIRLEECLQNQHTQYEKSKNKNDIYQKVNKLLNVYEKSVSLIQKLQGI